MTTHEQLQKYADLIATTYNVASLHGIASGMAGAPEHEYHLCSEDTHFIVFTKVDPVSMVDYNQMEEKTVLIVDADNLPADQLKDSEKHEGVPPMALVAALKVGAHILQRGSIHRYSQSGERIVSSLVGTRFQPLSVARHADPKLKKHSSENEQSCWQLLRDARCVHPRAVVLDATRNDDGTVKFTSYLGEDDPPILAQRTRALLDFASTQEAILTNPRGRIVSVLEDVSNEDEMHEFFQGLFA